MSKNISEVKIQKTLERIRPFIYLIFPNSHQNTLEKQKKNINAIFEKTKRMNGIMIFDEADALFGKRSRIKDSHDRYANIEVSYLLKKLEKYKGIMFVSSNLKKPTTKQFVAKIDYVICLPMKK